VIGFVDDQADPLQVGGRDELLHGFVIQDEHRIAQGPQQLVGHCLRPSRFARTRDPVHQDRQSLLL